MIDGLQLDLATAVARLQQIADEGGFYSDTADVIVAERLLTCDLPRLKRYLTPEALALVEEL